RMCTHHLYFCLSKFLKGRTGHRVEKMGTLRRNMNSLKRDQKLRLVESVWKEYFRDPSQWRDNRNSKISAAYPDFKHRVTNQPLWLDCTYNPSWIAEELRSRGLALPSQGEKSSKGKRLTRYAQEQGCNLMDCLDFWICPTRTEFGCVGIL
ncbi:hypothetical protein GOP47_0015970, partial [Adiantum capillus-veneris]